MSLSLYPYQEAVLTELRKGFAEGHRTQMVSAATGFGKTECAISLLDATARKGNRAAMLLDRIVLCNQTSERLTKYGIDHGVLQSGHWRYRPHEPIQVCSAQTLERRGSFPGLSLLIVDEAHQTRSQTVEFIKNNPGVKVVGLSATPLTKGLGQIYGNVVSTITPHELTEMGRLAPMRVFIAKEIDMTGAKKVAGEWSQGEATERGIRITGDIVSEWTRKTHELFGGPRKTVVFAAGVAHAADLAAKFNAAGYNFVALSYKDDDEFKSDAIKDFARPDTQIQGLIATDILTKGFDAADVMIGISARPFSKSLSSHIQQLGRIVRAHPGKDFAVLLCHSGNYLRFRNDYEDYFNNGIRALDEGLESPRKEPSEAEKEAAKCPACGYLWPAHADTCSACGFVRARRNTVVAVPGELSELGMNASARESLGTRQRWYSELLHIAYLRNYKTGWAWHKFRDKFGYEPIGLRREMADASPEVTRWVTSRAIARAKAMRKARA